MSITEIREAFEPIRPVLDGDAAPNLEAVYQTLNHAMGCLIALELENQYLLSRVNATSRVPSFFTEYFAKDVAPLELAEVAG